jgi:hypothetical protein
MDDGDRRGTRLEWLCIALSVLHPSKRMVEC